MYIYHKQWQNYANANAFFSVAIFFKGLSYHPHEQYLQHLCNDNSVGCPRFSSHLLLLYVGSLAGAKNGIANLIFIYPRVKLVCLVKLLVII